MPPVAGPTKVHSCFTCPVGKASGVGHGGRCRFIDRQHGRDEHLYVEGEAANHVYFVKRGTVVLTRSTGNALRDAGSRAVRTVGAFVGLEALMNPTYLDTARALTDVIVCGAHKDDMDAWLGPADSPARVTLQLVLSTLCAEPKRGPNPDGASVVRVARWILDDPLASSGAPVPRRIAADLLGMVPETLSRALAHLARIGAIEVSRSRLRVRDLDALKSVTEVGAAGTCNPPVKRPPPVD